MDFDIYKHHRINDSNNYNINLDCSRDLLDDYNCHSDGAPMHNRVSGSRVRAGSGSAAPQDVQRPIG